MALLHAAQLSPRKAEVVGSWLRAQPWAPDETEDLRILGAYRFDDPDGAVGLETFLVRTAGRTLQVALTYRDAPLAGAEDHLAGQMEHSVLGTRWAYDGAGDPAYLRMLAAATLTGVGQGVEVVRREGRDVVRPPGVRLSGGGWRGESCPVDGFGPPTTQDGWTTVTNGTLELRLAREPHLTEVELGWTLEGTWDGQETPLVLALALEVEPT